MRKDAVVIHSGGMDSSLCLSLAMREFGRENILSLSFSYGQRHSRELKQAAKICEAWRVDHAVLNIDYIKEITDSALTNSAVPIERRGSQPPNTLVVGRNGLMATLGAIRAHHLGAHCIYMGVIEREENHSGYRDCSRAYMDLKQALLRIDLGDPAFEIRTPLVKMSKTETLTLAEELGVLHFLLAETITCYEGIPKEGCRVCPACQLRNAGIQQYARQFPHVPLPYNL